jgi:hypothetical protein
MQLYTVDIATLWTITTTSIAHSDELQGIIQLEMQLLNQWDSVSGLFICDVLSGHYQ